MIPIQDQIARMVVNYYAQFPHCMRDDILHTQEVVAYTRMIALGEGASDDKLMLLESAAWLHDIGCPRSKELYGNSLPVNQQRVGREVTIELLEDFAPLDEAAKTWIADVVGAHHQAGKVAPLDFAPLFEADLIANLLSGYHKRENAEHLYKSLMTTTSGKELFRRLIAI